MLDAGIAGGSRGSVSADARGKIAAPGGFLIASARIDHGDGFIPVRPDQRGAADIRAPYDQWSGRVRYVTALNSDVEAQIALSAFGDARERGTPSSGNDSNGQDLSVRLLGRGPWAWEALAYAQNRSFQSEFAAVQAGRNTATTSLNQFKTPAKGYGAKFEVRPPLGENAELRLGADYRRVEGDTNEFFSYSNGAPRGLRKAGGENETIAAFAELSLSPMDRLSLTASARGDYWRIENGYLRETVLAPPVNPRNLVGADRDDFEGLGRVGASYALTDALSLRAAAYQGYRLPTLNELYRPFRAGADGTAANLGLEPEKLKGAEIGLEVEPVEKLKLGVTFFWNVLDDAIANVSVAKLPGDICPGVGVVSGACRQRQNLDEIESKGIELDASYAFGPWSVSGAYNYADAEVTGSGLTGLRPAQIPEHQGSLTLGWVGAQGVQASVTGRYVSSQFDDDQNARRLSSAASLDAYFAAPLRDGLKLELRGENVTGASIEAARSGFGVIEEASPRTLWVGLRYSLQ
jgi:vitamin B12 transporter